MTRLFDRVVAAIGLLVAAPMMGLVGCLIKRASPGPVLYRARRAGVGGQPFTMFKLRTMHPEAAHAGRITGGSDSRVFPLGAVLRRLKLDEIPQLLNVWRGEMSLVGPRPEDVTIVEEHYDAMMRESLTVRPGVTSPGSLHYYAHEASLPVDPRDAEAVYLVRLLPEKIALDLVYVRHMSLGYYVQILLRTLLGIVGLSKVFSRAEAWEREQADAILVARDHHG